MHDDRASCMQHAVGSHGLGSCCTSGAGAYSSERAARVISSVLAPSSVLMSAVWLSSGMASMEKITPDTRWRILTPGDRPSILRCSRMTRPHEDTARIPPSAGPALEAAASGSAVAASSAIFHGGMPFVLTASFNACTEAKAHDRTFLVCRSQHAPSSYDVQCKDNSASSLLQINASCTKHCEIAMHSVPSNITLDAKTAQQLSIRVGSQAAASQ